MIPLGYRYPKNNPSEQVSYFMNASLPKVCAVASSPAPQREWLAGIDLLLSERYQRTALMSSKHYGPLRVQRPFYPEADGCCHIYLLHPPGGLVIGDQLRIGATLEEGAQGLITTPSAGKLYGAKGANEQQGQQVEFTLARNSCLEWLPQETIIFDGANGALATKVNLCENAKYFGWDIIRLGRVASGEPFNSGSCEQKLQLWRDGLPLFIEKTQFEASSAMHRQKWGLQDTNTSATLTATLALSRDQIDDLLENMEGKGLSQSGQWGLTQKETVFIARYLGNSVTDCRKGFELIWQQTRTTFNGKNAITPRIWNT